MSPVLERARKLWAQPRTVTLEVEELGKVIVRELSELEWCELVEAWLYDDTGSRRDDRKHLGRARLIQLTATDEGGELIFADKAGSSENLQLIQTLPRRVVEQLHDAAWRLNRPPVDAKKNSSGPAD